MTATQKNVYILIEEIDGKREEVTYCRADNYIQALREMLDVGEDKALDMKILD